MKWEDFLSLTIRLPVIESEVLNAGVPDQGAIKVQLSRWRKAGRLIQIKRGVYLLSPTYRRIEVFELYSASILKKPSYISLEKAMEFHGLIPEGVPVYTSVTTKRPGRFASGLGMFQYHHVKTGLFWGYDSVTVRNQTGFVASPEKTFLDYFYLKASEISFDFLDGMRLQNMDKIDLGKLMKDAQRFQKPRMMDAAKTFAKYIRQKRHEDTIL